MCLCVDVILTSAASGENVHKVNETKGDNFGDFHFKIICIKIFSDILRFINEFRNCFFLQFVILEIIMIELNGMPKDVFMFNILFFISYNLIHIRNMYQMYLVVFLQIWDGWNPYMTFDIFHLMINVSDKNVNWRCEVNFRYFSQNHHPRHQTRLHAVLFTSLIC